MANDPLTTLVPNSNSTSSDFKFPRHYSFPPFFTPQPTLTSKHAQLQKWSSLILSYCAHYHIFKLTLSTALNTPLFHNERINKRLSRDDAKEILEFMREKGRVEYIGSGGDEIWIYWKTVEEWAATIEGWVEGTAQKGMVLTLYELVEGEGTVGQGIFTCS